MNGWNCPGTPKAAHAAMSQKAWPEDMARGRSADASMFADDTRISKVMQSPLDHIKLQDDLERYLNGQS